MGHLIKSLPRCDKRPLKASNPQKGIFNTPGWSVFLVAKVIKHYQIFDIVKIRLSFAADHLMQ